MERQRPASMLVASGVVLLGGVAGFLATPEHPVRTALLAAGIMLAGLLAVAVINVLIFAPLIAWMARGLGQRRDRRVAARPPARCDKTGRAQ